MNRSSEKLAESEKLQFLGGFLAAAHQAQIIQLAPNRSLAKILGIAQKREVALAQECRQHARNQQQHQPRRINNDGDGQSDGRDHQLDQPANLLNHAQPVGGLHPRPFQPVIENRIFVSDQVQFGGVLHHLNAHVAGCTCPPAASPSNRSPARESAQDRQPKFGSTSHHNCGGTG